jgi:hypothetical protein
MSTTALKSNSVKDEKFFSSFITNLKLVYNNGSSIINRANEQSSGSHHANKSVTSTQSVDVSVSNSNEDVVNEAKVKNKSKFKTIKIFVASNKNGKSFLISTRNSSLKHTPK